MSKIEWTDRSDWNPLRGCTRVSEGCRNCYAESIAARFSDPGQPFHGFAERTPNGPRWTGKVALMEERLMLPLKWKKPARIFVNSAFDLFHEDVPDAWIDRVFAVMALAPQHVYQVLTKRSKRMREYMTNVEREALWMNAVAAEIEAEPAQRAYTILDRREPWLPLPNCWLGVSAEDQVRADERIPDLLATPAAVRFVSAEPLLGDIDFTLIPTGRKFGRDDICEDALRGPPDLQEGERLDWIIVGGESGPGARPMARQWARDIRDQCSAAGVPFFFKQHGEFVPATDPNNGLPRYRTTGGPMVRVGKRRAGRLLDGVEHNAFPA